MNLTSNFGKASESQVAPGAAPGRRNNKNMKNRFFHTCMIVTGIVCAILLPQQAMGLAGFGEQSSKYHFNDFAVLSWSHPADGCDEGTECIRLERRGNFSRPFDGLDCTFDSISVPPDSRDSLMFAHRQKDRTWIIYDLKFERYLFETTSTEPDGFDKAMNIWQSFGFDVPEFVSAGFFANDQPYLFMAVPFLIRLDALGLPLLVIGFFRMFRLKKKNVYLIFALLSLAATAFLWYELLDVKGMVGSRSLPGSISLTKSFEPLKTAQLIIAPKNGITMHAFEGYDHDANTIIKDKSDPNGADRSLWNELSPLYRIYKREEGLPRLPRRRQRQTKNPRHMPDQDL